MGNNSEGLGIDKRLYWLRSHLFILLGVIPFAFINRNTIYVNFLGIKIGLTLLESILIAWLLIFITRYLSKRRSWMKELYLHGFSVIFFLSPVLISYAGLLGVLLTPLIFTALFLVINLDYYKQLMANELLKIQIGIFAGYLISSGFAFFLYSILIPTLNFDIIS